MFSNHLPPLRKCKGWTKRLHDILKEDNVHLEKRKDEQKMHMLNGEVAVQVVNRLNSLKEDPYIKNFG